MPIGPAESIERLFPGPPLDRRKTPKRAGESRKPGKQHPNRHRPRIIVM
jgi:hypothetical protein